MRIKPQKIVLSNGMEVLFRSLEANDVQAFYEHRWLTAQETYFMARYPEELIYNESQMADGLSRIAEDTKDFHLSAFVDECLIGDVIISKLGTNLKFSHRGNYAISIQQAYGKLGLGQRMTEMALKQAKENGFEQIELGVFADNVGARRLYDKVVFKVYGCLPRAFKLKDGSYRDEILMVRDL